MDEPDLCRSPTLHVPGGLWWPHGGHPYAQMYAVRTRGVQCLHGRVQEAEQAPAEEGGGVLGG